MNKLTVGILLSSVVLAACGSKDGGPQSFDEYQSEEITVSAADGTTLAGTLHVKNGSAKLVILFHQLSSNRNEWHDLRLALQDETEATVLAMDLRGHGQSTKRGNETLDWQDFTNSDWAELPSDVADVVAYAKGRSDLSPSALGLAGSSIGSSGVLIDAATDPSIGAIVLLSPGLDYRGLQTTQPMIDYGDRPALLVASDGDARSASAVTSLAGENGSATPIIYTGSSEHGVSMAEANPELLTTFADWFRDEL